ncbi:MULTISPECIES: beta-L-arabinofuranosidase domain-containing protein [unclassified Clostridium]|uniref:glycoside hydrolase family 127 protein n=1 Tax=unclassified Clostridium TaxID=2614128 RepID=UPI0011068431|nr:MULTISPECIES: beta-L-arabinofuranosidase domain-containing protein [unclassified Clostridium]
MNRIHAVPMKHVNIQDGFISRAQRLMRESVIPYQWRALNDSVPGAEKSYCIQNLKIAAGKIKGERGGMVFQDSDLAKWIEAAAYLLQSERDAQLEAHCDEIIDLMAQGQMEDGYFNTYFQLVEPQRRFKDLRDCHELYCCGHFIEAAVAYYEATGKRKLLEIMERMVALIAREFGPGEGQRRGYPGHQEIELALVKLYRTTGKKEYLDLAKFFIDERGREPYYFDLERQQLPDEHFPNSQYGREYFQAHLPVRQQQEVVGHSVRAMYMLCGMADVALETGDVTLYQACRRLWASTVQKRMYITGAIGSTAYGEAFTFDYHLPNDTIYGETCAAIGLCFFASRMLQFGADREYADILERALYNGVLSGISLDGERFFYVNPLEVWPQETREVHDFKEVKPQRQPWFGCACCPPNLARFISSLGQYAYGYDAHNLYIHLYIGGTVDVTLGDGTLAALRVDSTLPYGGQIGIEICSPGHYGLALRVPGWCQEYTVCVNGEVVKATVEDGYLYLHRDWMKGDKVTLALALEPVRMYANAAVHHDAGLVAIQYGPMVYCAEEADNGKDLHNLVLPSGAAIYAEYCENCLGGVMTLKTEGLRREGADDALYTAQPPRFIPQEIRLIPYFAWANRGEGEMRVWLQEK